MGLQHQDRLSTRGLRGPLLNQFMQSAGLRIELLAIASEVMRRHLAKLPTNTGNLRSTAKVSAHRSTDHPDRRWYAEYTVGGPRAPYILPLEEEGHYLAEALREMGYNTGDARTGPTGRVSRDVSRPTTFRPVEELNADLRAREEAEALQRQDQARVDRLRTAGYEPGQAIRVRDPGDGEPVEATVHDVRTGRGAFGVLADLDGERMEFGPEELLD